MCNTKKRKLIIMSPNNILTVLTIEWGSFSSRFYSTCFYTQRFFTLSIGPVLSCPVLSTMSIKCAGRQ